MSPNEPLFVLSNNKRVMRKDIIAIINSLTAKLRLNQTDYSGHSFKRGGAQSLKNAGVRDEIIQILGRLTSDAYKGYFEIKIAEIVGYATMMTSNK